MRIEASRLASWIIDGLDKHVTSLAAVQRRNEYLPYPDNSRSWIMRCGATHVEWFRGRNRSLIGFMFAMPTMAQYMRFVFCFTSPCLTRFTLARLTHLFSLIWKPHSYCNCYCIFVLPSRQILCVYLFSASAQLVPCLFEWLDSGGHQFSNNNKNHNQKKTQNMTMTRICYW
jgi:hypothetical protein